MDFREKYKNEGPIGEGYFSDVFRVTDAQGKKRAIKVLKKSLENDTGIRRRFARETQLLHKLRGCREVIRLLDYDPDERPTWYVMPRARQNLRDYIPRNNTKLSVEDRIGLFDQILSALVFAHKRDVLHRDLAPTNILIVKRDSSLAGRVSDFGLGRDMSRATRMSHSAAANYGHWHYVAPEQQASLAAATMRSDVYSLGKLLNFVMTAKTPDRYHPCQFPNVIRRATAYEPSDRFESAIDFAEAYSGVRDLLVNHVERTGPMTVSAYLGGDRVEWARLQQLILSPLVVSSRYSDFVAPIVGLFLDVDKLRQFIEAPTTDLPRVIQSFTHQWNQLYGTTGWPFNAMNRIARFFGAVYDATEDPEVQAVCLREIWHIAWAADQWDTQELTKRILRQPVADEVSLSLAATIMERREAPPPDYYAGIQMPPVLEQALIRLANEQPA